MHARGSRLWQYRPRVLVIPSQAEARRELARLGLSEPALEGLIEELPALAIRLEGMPRAQATALSKQFEALGGRCAAACTEVNAAPGPVILLGTVSVYRRWLAQAAAGRPEMESLADEIQRLLEYCERTEFPPLRTPRGPLAWGRRPLIMGIVNMTEGSFSGDGLGYDVAAAVEQARRFVAAGADMLDVGGESTRPGAPEVEEDEELRRVIPAVSALRQAVDVPISVDTRRARVAREAVAAGADLVNDIWAGRQEGMLETVAELGVPVCLMHMQGTPQTMQDNPHYDDVITEIYGFLAERVEAAVTAGIAEEQIIVDPGFGFGKLPEHNLEIMRRLREFRSLGRPVLIGPSRKSTIGQILDKPPDQRQWGTAAMVALAVANGADIVRVHDVAEMAQVAKVAEAVMGSEWES